MDIKRDVDMLLMDIGLAADETKVPEIVERHLKKLYFRGRRHVKDYLDAIETSASIDRKDLQ
tara:strand:- start:418 stop:603 length:186 start_codon:yes stop_codon:yes gene_type:complete